MAYSRGIGVQGLVWGSRFGLEAMGYKVLFFGAGDSMQHARGRVSRFGGKRFEFE